MHFPKNPPICFFITNRLPIFAHRKSKPIKMAVEDKEIILLKVSGQDKPGVTAGLTAILATYDAVILDIGQADIHNNLSLGILFQTKGSTSGEILKELL